MTAIDRALIDQISRTALAIMGEEEADLGPLPLDTQLQTAAGHRRVELGEDGLRQVRDALISDDVNHPSRVLFSRMLHRWDFLRTPGWGAGTAPNTADRRTRIYELLAVDAEFKRQCDERIPARLGSLEPTLITDQHQPWYGPERRLRNFYWNGYKRYLRAQGWDDSAINQLDRSTELVVERLDDPERLQIYQTKGLVVGYVQSGKTANFTGVIARAADAGYRMFIVLGGTLNILRRQTQRRLDKDLLGQEILEKGAVDQKHDYSSDDDWPRFNKHGELPSKLGSFDWVRLTGLEDDFKSLRRGIDALNFERERLFKDRRLNDPVNLHSLAARLLVVKKNGPVLRKLVQDLERMKGVFDQVPTLIIDDESDQASVNTIAPTRAEAKKRTAINQHLIQLLKVLPRAQYVGYTATPFANVFVDPQDAEDLFPKDYILALERPEGYMGVSDFHDLDAGSDAPHPNRDAFVREVYGEDDNGANLPKAIDSFVLGGALKLWREAHAPPGTSLRFKHHTMLVHRSHKIAEHESDRRLVEALYDRGGYRSARAQSRLRHLFEDDFAVVSARQEPSLRFPESFDALQPYLAECLDRIERAGAVRVVNGKNVEESPDFDRESVWSILVGGTKLSRGYTVEGLTVSYYRRTADSADTLMQMGRWFGFRRGYRDLVRLFIGRAERKGKTTVDLYQAFESICMDEEEFRKKLRKYVEQEHITPKQVPPLVPSIYGKPTAKNKMFNAVLASENISGEWRESTLAPEDDASIRANEAAMRHLLKTVDMRRSPLRATFEDENIDLDCIWGVAAHAHVLSFYNAFRWSVMNDPAHGRVAEYMAGRAEEVGDPQIDDWLIVAPQREAPIDHWDAGRITYGVVRRGRVASLPGGPARFKAYSDPRHRRLVAGILHVALPAPSIVDTISAGLAKRGRGVLLFYPCRDPQTDRTGSITMGFSLLFPRNEKPKRAYFSVRDKRRGDEVTVDLRSAGLDSPD
jgi:hypothetical protein